MMPAAGVTIRYTPPGLAAGHSQREELDWISEAVDEHGRLSAQTRAELRSSGWLSQDEQRRGGYLSTLGLRERCSHPELVILNVPGAFAETASAILNDLAAYLLESERSFAAGEIYARERPGMDPLLLSFADTEEELSALFGSEPVLVVLPLP
jgi:hypothetical protein